MKGKLIAVLATAAAALFLVATGIEQAAAQRGGRDGARSAAPPSGGPRFRGGPSGGPRFDGGRRSSRQFDGRGPRTFSRERSPSFGYAPRYDRRDRRRRLRVRPFFYGAPLYGSYGYRPCGYSYRRAVATGSSYWWRRYRACTLGYD